MMTVSDFSTFPTSKRWRLSRTWSLTAGWTARTASPPPTKSSWSHYSAIAPLCTPAPTMICMPVFSSTWLENDDEMKKSKLSMEKGRLSIQNENVVPVDLTIWLSDCLSAYRLKWKKCRLSIGIERSSRASLWSKGLLKMLYSFRG